MSESAADVTVLPRLHEIAHRAMRREGGGNTLRLVGAAGAGNYYARYSSSVMNGVERRAPGALERLTPVVYRQQLQTRRWSAASPCGGRTSQPGAGNYNARYNFSAMSESAADVTVMLQAWGAGDPGALERLTPVVYRQLHEIAHRAMRRERPGNTLQTTALIHEAFLRLVGGESVRWQDRAHFFAVSAQMMRRILVDAARARAAEKRGGSAARFQLNESIDCSPERDHELVALDDALAALGEMDPRKAQVVELRFFGGLSVEETAEVLKVSPQTVMRDWKLARAWLLREMS